MQRDLLGASARRKKYEELWAVYRDVAYKGFREKFQMEFFSCWWEMYLATSIIRRGLSVVPGQANEGPDIKVKQDCSTTIWIEATAPQRGNSADKIPEEQYDCRVKIEPTDKTILRLAQGLQTKQKKFEEYIQKGTVEETDCLVIALSPCSYQDVAMMGLNFDEPDPLAFLVGYDASKVIIYTDGSTQYGTSRMSISRASGSHVRTDPFNLPEFGIISGILYSVESPFYENPGDQHGIRLYLNPKATRPLPEYFTSAFETWFLDERNSRWSHS